MVEMWLDVFLEVVEEISCLVEVPEQSYLKVVIERIKPDVTYVE